MNRMLALIPKRRSVQVALTTVGLVVLVGAPSAFAWPQADYAGAAASASHRLKIQRVSDRGWSNPPTQAGSGPGYGPSGYGPPGPPPPNWQPDRPGASMYDKRNAAYWGAAAAAGAIGLNAINSWALQNSGPPPGYDSQGMMAPVSTLPDPNELGPRHPRPAPGPDAIGSPSPTRLPEQSGCYTAGPQLICPNY